MPVKQITVNLENLPGKLSELTSYLGENGINMIAVSVADLADTSAVRFVANDPEKAVNVLQSHGYSAKVTDVLALEVPNHPGKLNAVLKPLKEKNINVSDLYACLERGEKTVLILRADKMEEAVRVLKEHWIRIVDEKIYVL